VILDVCAMLGVRGADHVARKAGRGREASPSEWRQRLGALASARLGGSYVGLGLLGHPRE
jgi:hypothetical protein